MQKSNRLKGRTSDQSRSLDCRLITVRNSICLRNFFIRRPRVKSAWRNAVAPANPFVNPYNPGVALPYSFPQLPLAFLQSRLGGPAGLVDGDYPFVALGWFEFVENQGIHDRTSFISGQSLLDGIHMQKIRDLIPRGYPPAPPAIVDSGGTLGIFTLNKDPFPGVDLTSISPPCWATILLAIKRPRPVP